MCVYLRNYSSEISLVIYNNYEDSLIYINNIYLMDIDDNLINKI
jgi:hypothetical protein